MELTGLKRNKFYDFTKIYEERKGVKRNGTN